MGSPSCHDRISKKNVKETATTSNLNKGNNIMAYNKWDINNAVLFFKSFERKDYFGLILSIGGFTLLEYIRGVWPNSTINPIIAVLITTVILIGTLIFFNSDGGENAVDFNFSEGSSEEADFFANWYNRPGKHIVYCSDVNWLEPKSYNQVVTNLKQAKGNLTLYLENIDHKIVTQFIGEGASVNAIDPNPRLDHAFSINLHGEKKSVIIRNKLGLDLKISGKRFEHYPLLVDLLNDVIGIE